MDNHSHTHRGICTFSHPHIYKHTSRSTSFNAKTATSVSTVPTNDHFGAHTHPVPTSLSACPAPPPHPTMLGGQHSDHMPPTNPRAEEEIRAQNGEWLA